MKEIGVMLSGAVLIGCLFCLVVIVAGCVLCHLVSGWNVWRKKRHAVVMSAVAVIAIIVGGSKPARIVIRWDDGLHDNGSMINTNDLRFVEIRWRYDAWIPDVATFTLSAIEINSVNPDPTEDRLTVIGSCPITNLSMTVMMERDATNYMFFAEQSFIPDAPVVTNGVYHIKCVGGENVWVPVGLKIYGDGNVISPPPPPEGENYLSDLINGGNQ